MESPVSPVSEPNKCFGFVVCLIAQSRAWGLYMWGCGSVAVYRQAIKFPPLFRFFPFYASLSVSSYAFTVNFINPLSPARLRSSHAARHLRLSHAAMSPWDREEERETAKKPEPGQPACGLHRGLNAHILIAVPSSHNQLLTYLLAYPSW